MVDWTEVVGDPGAMIGVAVTAVTVYALTVLNTRVGGARSMAALSTFDFVVNVAIGAMVGSAAIGSSSILDAVTGIVVLFVLQLAASALRMRTKARSLVDNCPLLLMHNGRFIEEHLRRARVTKGDVHAALRKHNVRTYDEVDAVVFEATGSLSVLHGSDDAYRFDNRMLEGVDGYDPDSLRTAASDGKADR